VPTGAAATVVSVAVIGEPGAQLGLLSDPNSGVPVENPDQPSLPAGDPSGFTHDTCHH